MEQLLDAIKIFWNIEPYFEGDKLLGFEIDTYTNRGVNILIFIDYRGTDKDVNNPKDFYELFKSYINDFDVDENITLYRGDEGFRNAFTLKQSLKDFSNFKKELKRIKRMLKAVIKMTTENKVKVNKSNVHYIINTAKKVKFKKTSERFKNDEFTISLIKNDNTLELYSHDTQTYVSNVKLDEVELIKE